MSTWTRPGSGALFAAAGVEVELCRTESEEEAVARSRRAVAGGAGRPIVAAGGDGTFHTLARVLLDLGDEDRAVPALGILPLGSVMNVARSLGHPSRARRAPPA